jgi:hypothetical protein
MQNGPDEHDSASSPTMLGATCCGLPQRSGDKLGVVVGVEVDGVEVDGVEVDELDEVVPDEVVTVGVVGLMLVCADVGCPLPHAPATIATIATVTATDIGPARSLMSGNLSEARRP